MATNNSGSTTLLTTAVVACAGFMAVYGWHAHKQMKDITDKSAYEKCILEEKMVEAQRRADDAKAVSDAAVEAQKMTAKLAADRERRMAEQAAERERKMAEDAKAAMKSRASAKVQRRVSMLRTKYKREAVELAATVDVLDTRIKAITRDLEEYQDQLAKIVVPSRVLVTNVYRYCTSATATTVREKVLTAHEMKVKRILQAFDNKVLEEIYCRYMPGSSFRQLKSELVEEFRAIKDSHELFTRGRASRRKSYSSEIQRLNNRSEAETRKLKRELNEDLDIVKSFNHTATDSPLYEIRKKKAEAVIAKHNVSSVTSAENVIRSRLKALDDASHAFENRFQVADVVRREANADVDAESEERFRIDKTACVQRHYDKLSHGFVTMLEAEKARLTADMQAALQRASNMTTMLDNWDLLDEERLDRIAKDTLDKIVNAVAGMN